MPRGHMPKAEAARAVGRLLAGQTQNEHGVSQSVIQRLWQKYLDTGAVARRRQSGRRRSTSAREDRAIVVMAKRHRFDSAVTLNREFQNASGVRISVQTYRTGLHEANLRARRPAVPPPLTPPCRLSGLCTRPLTLAA